MDNLLLIEPGRPVKRAAIPCLAMEDFRQTLLDGSDREGAVVQFFGYREKDELFLLAILRRGGLLYAGCCRAPETYPSLTRENARFHLFEREIAEQFGVLPEGHPWLKNVRFHPNWTGRDDAFGNSYENIPGNYPYFRVEGDEIHEVAVGPVHAGIIEPGHFRFQCIGEKVLHLEIQLGYQHRGIERLVTGAAPQRLPVILESAVGDSAVAASICHSRAMEGLQGIQVSDTAARIRALTLELERLANHTGDLGALAGDVAFTTAASYFGRLRGEFLNLLLLLCGNRFGKGLVRPGGVVCSWTEGIREKILAKIEEVEPDIMEVSELIFSAHTILGRFEGCGTVNREAAEEVGLVGFAGRASGLDYDARFRLAPDNTLYEHSRATKTSGDVFARAWIRYEEILYSLVFVKNILQTGFSTPDLLTPPRGTGVETDALVVTMTEAWRGELCHCLLTDENGGMLRYKIKDPSFHNWIGLALAMRNEGISDFPLNNKSFNLSYCGFDL